MKYESFIIAFRKYLFEKLGSVINLAKWSWLLRKCHRKRHKLVELNRSQLPGIAWAWQRNSQSNIAIDTWLCRTPRVPFEIVPHWITERLTICMDLSLSELCWSDRHFFGCDHFFGAGLVPMETNKRAVNLATLIICLGSQNFKDSLPGTALTPALVMSVNHSKVTKVFGLASMDLPLKSVVLPKPLSRYLLVGSRIFA